MDEKHNAVLVGGPADGETMHVSAHVEFINLRRNDALHEYSITDHHQLVDGSLLLIWRHRGTVED
jgi:hypothetical protein